MKFLNMPAMFSLLAGLVACVATFIAGMSMLNSLIWIFASLLVFYIIGLALKALFNVILNDDIVDEKTIIMGEDGFENIGDIK